MFYLNLKENGINYMNQLKQWTFYSYFWRYRDPKQAFCADIYDEFNRKIKYKTDILGHPISKSKSKKSSKARTVPYLKFRPYQRFD